MYVMESWGNEHDLYRKYTDEPLYHAFMFSLVSLLSGV